MGIIGDIIELIKGAINFIKNIFIKILHRAFDFFNDTVKWLKSLNLNQHRDVPFIARGEDFKDIIKNAPRKNEGIFQGVYDEETEEITHNEWVESEGLDDKTREVLKNDPLVVLQ